MTDALFNIEQMEIKILLRDAHGTKLLERKFYICFLKIPYLEKEKRALYSKKTALSMSM